jgi:hypothetical protein
MKHAWCQLCSLVNVYANQLVAQRFVPQVHLPAIIAVRRKRVQASSRM